MKLLIYENYEVTISPEAWSLSVFRALWDRDKTKDKSVAKLEMAYIYFMEDVCSDYQVYTDRNERSTNICKDEGFPKSWKPDKQVEAAIEFFRTKQPIQARWLESERIYINKLEKIMLDINPGATNNEGRFINPLNQSTQLIDTYNKAIKQYSDTEKAIFTEIHNEEKVRGSQEKADFENLNF